MHKPLPGLALSRLCPLLEELERIQKLEKRKDLIASWFRENRFHINTPGTHLALLSILFLHQRPNIVLWTYEAKLLDIVRRVAEALHGGSEIPVILGKWKTENRPVAECVRDLYDYRKDLHEKESNNIIVNEIIYRLSNISDGHRAARKYRKRVRDRQMKKQIVLETLNPRRVFQNWSYIFEYVTPWEAYWITRTVLKDLPFLEDLETFISSQVYQLLPTILRVCNDLPIALQAIEKRGWRPGPVSEIPELKRDEVLKTFKPQFGTMVKPPDFAKPWTIDHFLKRYAGARKDRGPGKYLLDRKFDGEYCQVHIKKESHDNGLSIEIYSKSGKISTDDRSDIIPYIREAMLRENFSDWCVLVGELMVCNENGRILSFDEIRKHVTRLGGKPGCQGDEPPGEGDHLCVHFFDCLACDDLPIIHDIPEDRREQIKNLVKPTPGYVSIATFEHEIDSKCPTAKCEIENWMQHACKESWEGYVLYPKDAPYVNIGGLAGWNPIVKLKCKTIGKYGDTADFAIVGGRTDHKLLSSTKNEFRLDKKYAKEADRLYWTHFYVACIVNMDHVRGDEIAPTVRIIQEYDRATANKANLVRLHQHAFANRADKDHPPKVEFIDSQWVFDESKEQDRIFFVRPIIAEFSAYQFDKLENMQHYALRFPYVEKLKGSGIKELGETMSFQKLQQCGKETSLSRNDLGDHIPMAGSVDGPRSRTEFLTTGNDGMNDTYATESDASGVDVVEATAVSQIDRDITPSISSMVSIRELQSHDEAEDELLEDTTNIGMDKTTFKSNTDRDPTPGTDSVASSRAGQPVEDKDSEGQKDTGIGEHREATPSTASIVSLPELVMFQEDNNKGQQSLYGLLNRELTPSTEFFESGSEKGTLEQQRDEVLQAVSDNEQREAAAAEAPYHHFGVLRGLASQAHQGKSKSLPEPRDDPKEALRINAPSNIDSSSDTSERDDWGSFKAKQLSILTAARAKSRDEPTSEWVTQQANDRVQPSKNVESDAETGMPSPQPQANMSKKRLHSKIAGSEDADKYERPRKLARPETNKFLSSKRAIDEVRWSPSYIDPHGLLQEKSQSVGNESNNAVSGRKRSRSISEDNETNGNSVAKRLRIESSAKVSIEGSENTEAATSAKLETVKYGTHTNPIVIEDDEVRTVTIPLSSRRGSRRVKRRWQWIESDDEQRELKPITTKEAVYTRGKDTENQENRSSRGTTPARIEISRKDAHWRKRVGTSKIWL